MKIAIPNFDENIGSQRIPFKVYRTLLESRFPIIFISYDSIQDADIVFVHSDLSIISKLKIKNPTAKFILFKPHCEIALACSGDNLIKRIISYFINIKNNLKNNPLEIYKNNIDNADLLVCDTPRISRHFRSKGYNTIYCSLLELFNKDINNFSNKKKTNSDYIKILYSGNLSHFNSNIKEFVKALSKSKMLLGKEIIIFCLSSFSNVKDDLRIYRGITIKYIKFSEQKLNHLLSDCDFGWAPNNYKISSFLDNYLSRVLLTTSTQIFDLIKVEKFSANVGRVLLFARYSIPFITNPNEETSMIFGKLNEYCFYENFDELVFLLNHYSDKDKLDDLRIILKKNFNYLDFSIGEVSKLYNAIKSI